MVAVDTFGDWLQHQIDLRGWSNAECARRIGVSWPRLNNIIHGLPRRADGGPSVPRRETVESIAKALQVDAADALLAAGYAPGKAPKELFDLVQRSPTIPPAVGGGWNSGWMRSKEPITREPFYDDLEQLEQEVEFFVGEAVTQEQGEEAKALIEELRGIVTKRSLEMERRKNENLIKQYKELEARMAELAQQKEQSE